jgi:predicted aspartyl protease
MINPRCTGFPAKVWIAFLVIGTAAQAIWAQSEIRFRLVNNLVIISLKSNHAGPYDFVMDTGADTTVIDSSIAPGLSFSPLDHIRQTTLSGVQTVTRGSIPSLSVGTVEVDNIDALVRDLSVLRKMDIHIEGILGQNFLSHFNYLLDYGEQMVRIEVGSEIQNSVEGDHVSIDGREHRMLVTSEAQTRGNARLQLMLDSGAGCLVLMPRAVQELNLPKQGNELESTSNGRVELHTTRIRALAVGSQHLHNLNAVLSNIEPAERIGDGMLPTVLFRALYVNNQENFVVFNPRIKGRAHSQ